jgi:hypothetical protein
VLLRKPTRDGRNRLEGPRIYLGRQLLSITIEIYKVILQANKQASSARRSLAILSIKKLVNKIKHVAKTLYTSNDNAKALE